MEMNSSSRKLNNHVIQPIDKILASEIQKYDLIYNTLSSEYKDVKMTELAWKKIGKEMYLTPFECKRRWKNMRDRYVRMRKTMGHGVPEIFECFSFLNPYIKHKEVEAETKVKKRSATSFDHGSTTKKTKTYDNMESIVILDDSPMPDDLIEGSFIEAKPHFNRDSCENETFKDTDLSKDALGRFALSMSDLLRAIHKRQRSNAMFDVHKVLNAYINEQQVKVEISSS
ncbi:uncharacterized protein [Lepeophtheirus salmonis]|uniref:uncharacterized protein isoform X2 n=1 Tax=Lepeophtheirus salmonis TaxID=72036 RepID=UPI001AEAB878|nr:uncharacterized protein LOC121115216 isoform X2 [Lepeophtheirus salmonis]